MRVWDLQVAGGVPVDDVPNVPVPPTPVPLPADSLAAAREALDRAKADDVRATRDREEVRKLVRTVASRRTARWRKRPPN